LGAAAAALDIGTSDAATMLDFCDKPYEFVPARRRGWFAWLCGHLNRRVRLPRHHQVSNVEVSGQETLFNQLRGGDRLLLTPNHPTHCDPEIMFEVMRQLGIPAQFMAAYDVFVRSRLNAFVMSRCGAFSVDREGLDARALRHAAEVLLQGRYALTIFPEGNVFLQNDLVGPFNEGAAFLALKAAKELAPGGVRTLVVPVSIKATYVEDIRPGVDQRLARLAEAVEADTNAADPLAQLRGVAFAALRRNQRMRGLPQSEWDEPRLVIERAVVAVLDRLEQKVGLPPAEHASLLERVCRVRRAIHQVRVDEQRRADHQAAASWADEAMMAFKVASYLGDYVHRRPTLDRYAETVEKLDEDIHSRMPQPFGPRQAYVRIGHPIDLAEHLDAPGKKMRAAVEAVTRACQQAVQVGLDEINAANPHPGARLICQPQPAHAKR
jgi:1-acyl-sn-glycerol-3-phosphate acyltransferase